MTRSYTPACSATETSSNIEIFAGSKLNYDTFQVANNKGANQTAWMQTGQHLCCLHATISDFLCGAHMSCVLRKPAFVYK